MSTNQNELQAMSLIKEIIQCHEMSIAKVNEGLEWALRCGELLVQCKAHLGHGNLGGFIEQYFPFCERTAREYMKLHKDLEQIPKRQRAAVLKEANSVRALQKLLPGPSTKDEIPAPEKPEPESEPESDSPPPEEPEEDEEPTVPETSFPVAEEEESAPEKPNKPNGKPNSKPPKQYEPAALLKQWEGMMGPMVRWVDKTANGLGEANSEWHTTVQEHLNIATEELHERMGRE